MTALAELLQRLETAAEGGRELDAAIFKALGGPLPDEFMGVKVDLQWQPDGNATIAVGDMQVRYEPPTYTTSLDDALALVERVLPGWFWRGGRVPSGRWTGRRYVHGWAHLQRSHADHCDRKDEATGWGEDVPIALCIALLRALTAQEQSHG